MQGVKAQANASDVSVLNESWYVASSPGLLASEAGDLVVLGEVQNIGTGIIQNVTLSATALSANGTVLGTASTQDGMGTVFTYQTQPQAKAPFIIDFESSASWSSQVANVSVTVLSAIYASSVPYEGLNMAGTPTAFNNNGTYTLVGTIINNGSQTMGYVWVVTTFYNSAGQVVGLNFTDYLASPAAPIEHNGAVFYEATPADNTATLSSEISTFSYQIDSVPLGSEPIGDSTPTATPITASKSGALLPTVIVIIVIAAVAALALLLVRKRRETPLPPPPPPPPPETPEQ